MILVTLSCQEPASREDSPGCPPVSGREPRDACLPGPAAGAHCVSRGRQTEGSSSFRPLTGCQALCHQARIKVTGRHSPGALGTREDTCLKELRRPARTDLRVSLGDATPAVGRPWDVGARAAHLRFLGI